MPKTKTRVWDPAEHLITGEDMAAYLEATLQEGGSALVAAALGDITRQVHESECPRRGVRAREPLQGAIGRGQPRICDLRSQIRVAVACVSINHCRMTTKNMQGAS